MKIIKPYTQIIDEIDGQKILKKIEMIGRTCYKSEGKIKDDSAEKFVAGLIMRGHEAVLEHESITIKFVVDRGISHELVRHRIASFAQESTRYCNYSKDDFDSEITVIEPFFLEKGTGGWDCWHSACWNAETEYFNLLNWGCTAQESKVCPSPLFKNRSGDDCKFA